LARSVNPNFFWRGQKTKICFQIHSNNYFIVPDLLNDIKYTSVVLLLVQVRHIAFPSEMIKFTFILQAIACPSYITLCHPTASPSYTTPCHFTACPSYTTLCNSIACPSYTTLCHPIAGQSYTTSCHSIACPNYTTPCHSIACPSYTTLCHSIQIHCIEAIIPIHLDILTLPLSTLS
jgi:hypothetical protein